MSTDTYITIGVYLKCKARTYKGTSESVPFCPRGHLGQHGPFCSKCGVATEKQHEVLAQTYTWWDLIQNDIEDAPVSTDERDLLETHLSMIDSESAPDGVDYLLPKSTTQLDAKHVAGEYEIIPENEMNLSPNELIDRLMDAMHHHGILELLEIIYEKVEFKYGILATWS